MELAIESTLSFSIQRASAQNHEGHMISSHSVNSEMMTGVVLLFLVTVHVLLPNVLAQPGNRTEEGSNVTGTESLKAGLPLPQLVNSSTAAEENSPEAHPTACIRSLADLRQAYLDFKTAPGSWPQDSTIFSYHPTDAVKYTSLAIFYDYSTEKDGDQPTLNSTTTSSLNSTGCCNPENTSSCVVFLRHHSHLYEAAYAPLIYLYAFPTSPNRVGKFDSFKKKIRDTFGVRKLCWKVPPFCMSSEMVVKGNSGLLKAFTAEVSANTCNTHKCTHAPTHSHTHANAHTGLWVLYMCKYTCIYRYIFETTRIVLCRCVYIFHWYTITDTTYVYAPWHVKIEADEQSTVVANAFTSLIVSVNVIDTPL